MSTIGLTYPQLIDAHKASAEGQVLDLLSQNNAVLDDAMAVPCNMGKTHMASVLTGLPDATWGRLYKGTPQSKATYMNVEEATGFMESYASIDTRALKLATDKARARLVASRPYFETLNQKMASNMFYANVNTTPEGFHGLAARYDTYGTGIPDPAAPNIVNQVINGKGTGSDNTSIWFVTWADHATTLLYPSGTQAGIQMEDKGEQKTLDAAGNPFFTKDTYYAWHMGVAVGDYRYNSRIANIDVSDLLDGKIDVWELMRKAYYRLAQIYPIGAKGGRTACYMNRQVLEMLDAQSSDRSLVNSAGTYNYSAPGLGQAQIEGKMIRTYRDIPIRLVDAILNTEAAVPAAA